MKKFLLFILILAIGFLFFGNRSQVKVFSAEQSDSNSKNYARDEKDLELATTIQRFADRSPDGLVKKRAKDGGITIDLQGRFQNVMLARSDAGDDLPAACVTSLEEADAFFGRNLMTGDPVYSALFQRVKSDELAVQYGMTREEFKFYNDLIIKVMNRDALSPQASTITIVNNDGPGEGFNDTTPKAPDGANNGATLGAQRLNLFNFAAGIWGAFLDSNVTINVRSQFDPLTCTPTSAVLGSAGAVNVNANFANAPFTNTWYHAALANKRAGSDLVPAQPEINATFNSTVNGTPGCLDNSGTAARFYYGFDNTTPANTINLLVVLLHEMGHGLGFSSFVSTLGITGATNASPIVITLPSGHGLVNNDQITVTGATGNTAANGTWIITGVTATTAQLVGSIGNGAYSGNGIIRGANLQGLADAWSRLMFDRTANKSWFNMTTAERSASILNTSNLLWDGPSIKLASGSLAAGRDAVTGRVQMFAPNPFQQGSSVSHWDTAASPNLLMEPVINAGLPIDLDLTRQQTRDIGWYRDTTADTVPDTITNITPSGGNAYIGDVMNITWINNGSFNRNITIELSTDGGATFPTTIASNVANTGSFSWTVPNSPTILGRIRVREYNFADPIGVSTANFSILFAPTAASVSISGRVVATDGRAIYRAVITVTDVNGNARTSVTNAFGYYRIDGIAAGGSYAVAVTHKQYRFAPQIFEITDDVADLDFVPLL